MRFVSPETVRIQLKASPDGSLNWIDVKKDLSVGEDKHYRAAGMESVTPREGQPSDVKINWVAMAFARVEMYLTDWSPAYSDDPSKRKPVALTPDAIRALEPQDFEEIDTAIQAHIAARTEEKKQTNGSHTLTAISAS